MSSTGKKGNDDWNVLLNIQVFTTTIYQLLN